MKAYSITILIFLLSACASKPNRASFPELATKQNTNEIYTPSLGSKNEAMIGDSLFYKVIKRETQNIAVTLLNDSKADMDNGYSISLKYGQTSLLYKLNKKHNAFCDKVTAKSLNILFIGNNVQSCLVDLDNSGDFEKAFFSGYNRFFPLDNPIKYNLSDLTPKVLFEESGFRREAIYQGVNDTTIKVLFREYKNNYIRDSFSQTIHYELDNNGESVIAFKGFKAKVHKATGTEIIYTVVSPFSN